MKQVLNFELNALLIIYFFLLFFSTLVEFLGLSSILIFLNFTLDIENNFIGNYLKFIDDFNDEVLKLNTVIYYISIIVFFLILKNLIIASSLYLKEKISVLIGNKLSIKIYDTYLNEDLSFHENNSLVKLYRNVLSETRKAGSYILNILQILNDSILMLSIGLFVFLANKDLFLISILTLIPAILLYYFVSKYQVDAKSKNLLQLRYLLLRNVIDTLSLIREIRFFNNLFYFRNYFKKKLDSYQKNQVFVQFIKKLPRNFYEIIILLSIFIIVISLVEYGYEKKQIFSFLSILVVAFLRMMPSISSLTSTLAEKRENKISFNAILSKLRNNKKFTLKKLGKVNNLKLNKINFRYNNKKIFNNLTCNFENFNMIGIQGQSGSGKSTLAKLICNILNYQNGEIIYNNFEKAKKNIYYNFSYLESKGYLLNGNIKDNILFGSKYHKAKLNNILNIVCLNQNLLSKKAKNKEIDNVSTGQKQRILLARSLYKNPSLIILDEILSNLDNKIAFKIINNLKKNKISVIILSHNEKHFFKCDEIYRVKDEKLKKIN